MAGKETKNTENQVADEVVENNESTEEVKEEVVEENTENKPQEKVVEESDGDQANEYLEKWQRTIAEFDNFRKRTIKEKAMMYENGAKEVLEKILPVVDNFERAISHIPEEVAENDHAKGVLMIYKQLMTTMEDLGVKEIEALNAPFDPNFHHAVAHEESDELGENEVAEVFQKGYMYKDKVLRHSMVKVVN